MTGIVPQTNNRPVPDSYRVEALCPESPGSRGMIWKTGRWHDPVAYRIVCCQNGQEQVIYDNHTTANEVCGVLNIPRIACGHPI